MIESGLDLNLAAHAGEATILGKRQAVGLQGHDIVSGSVESGGRYIFSDRVMDARVVLIDLEIVEDDPRLHEAVRVGIRVEDEPAASQILDLGLYRCRSQQATLLELAAKRSLALGAVLLVLWSRQIGPSPQCCIENAAHGRSKVLVAGALIAQVLFECHESGPRVAGDSVSIMLNRGGSIGKSESRDLQIRR